VYFARRLKWIVAPGFTLGVLSVVEAWYMPGVSSLLLLIGLFLVFESLKMAFQPTAGGLKGVGLFSATTAGLMSGYAFTTTDKQTEIVVAAFVVGIFLIGIFCIRTINFEGSPEAQRYLH
jgi:hypothetical protein